MKLLKPYEGCEKYVFAAFSRPDERRSIGIIEQLFHSGIRIWYDNATTNKEYIVDRLKNCETFLLFVSRNTVVSHNCRQLLNRAILEEKAVSVIFLEKTTLTPGMELQLSSKQSVSVWETDSEGLFAQLLNQDMIKACTADLPSESRDTASENSNYILLRKNTGDRIKIPCGSLTVGRRRSQCDYTIEGNKTLSRVHATFRVKNNRCSVTDNNSLNGVFVNGEKLAESTQAELKLNDEIRLGSERFVLLENT